MVTWIKPVWEERADGGLEAVVGTDGTERFTVQLTERRGFWFSSFGGIGDLPERRVTEGPFATLQVAKRRFEIIKREPSHPTSP